MVTARRTLRIASRGSQLALWQSHSVRDTLLARDPDLDIEIEVIRTTGDRILDVPLARIGDRGLFTKEIDEALLSDRADLAVHSLKDVPTRLPEGLEITAIGEREDARDVLIGRSAPTLGQLRPGARVGTSSLRRRAQLKHLRPDLDVVDLRGNLNTRLGRLDAGEYDAIVLAAAGVYRLGWSARITETLPLQHWLPAVGQGALGIVTRGDDAVLGDLLRPAHHLETVIEVGCERAFLRALEGGCQVPIGAFATSIGGRLHLDGLIADPDGHAMIRDRIEGATEDAAALGRELAGRLLGRGGDRILAQLRNGGSTPAAAPP